jgi:hypothetical protein
MVSVLFETLAELSKNDNASSALISESLNIAELELTS